MIRVAAPAGLNCLDVSEARRHGPIHSMSIDPVILVSRSRRNVASYRSIRPKAYETVNVCGAVDGDRPLAYWWASARRLGAMLWLR